MASLLSRLFGGASAFSRAPAAPDTKASRTGALLAIHALGIAQWTPRNAGELTRQGFERNAIVYRCVRMIAESAATIPWLVYEGGVESEAHPLRELIGHPNPGSGGAQFLEGVFTNLMLFGNAYIEAVGVDGLPREWHNLRPDRMSILPGRTGWPAGYEYTLGAQKVTFPVEPDGVSPVLHLKLFHPLDDHYGFAPLCAAQTALDIHNAAGGWNKALLDNAARPSGALVYTGPDGASLSEEQFERLRRDLDESFSGPRNAGRPLLLDGGLDWKALSLTPKDMDFVAAQAAAAREIALAFGVPPLVLGLPGDNTFSNYQEANRAFWRQAVIPLVKRTQQSFASWLRPVYGEFSIEADLDRIDALAGEREAEWRRIGAAGFLSDDEKREAVGFGGGKSAKQGRKFGIFYDGGDKEPVDVQDSLSDADGGGGFGDEHWRTQPRVPPGNPDGGQWTEEGGGGGGRAEIGDTRRSEANDAGRNQEALELQRVAAITWVCITMGRGSSTVDGRTYWFAIYECPGGQTIRRESSTNNLPGLILDPYR